ncbi:MAG: hypothetical protein IJY25_02395 [Bacilli bacterium]|nr:hypothetical protein [Bacilli bacterium]
MARIKSYQDYLDQVNGDISKQSKTRRIIFSNKVKSAIATLLIVTGLGTLVASCKKEEKSKQNTNGNSSSTYTSVIESTSLNELGVELPINTTEKKEYGATSKGVANPNKVVKDTTSGKIYVDQDAYENKNEVGTTVIDTKNDTLEVKDNGKVYEKEDSYVIKDEETDKVKEEGKIDKTETKYTPDGTPIPDGYVWDEVRKKIVPESEYGKYVIDEDGNLVLKETYEETKKAPTGEDAVIEEKTEEVITPIEKEEVKTEQKEETKVEESEEIIEVTTEEVVTKVTDPGVTNADGTYTVNGLTFESKADYQQWIIQGFAGYGMDIDGIMKSEESLVQSNTLTK